MLPRNVDVHTSMATVYSEYNIIDPALSVPPWRDTSPKYDRGILDAE